MDAHNQMPYALLQLWPTQGVVMHVVLCLPTLLLVADLDYSHIQLLACSTARASAPLPLARLPTHAKRHSMQEGCMALDYRQSRQLAQSRAANYMLFCRWSVCSRAIT